MNIITQIAAGAVTAWHEIEADIEADVAKVKAALPASALPGFDATVSDIKQGASDTLSTASSSLGAAAPDMLKGLDALVDAAIATLTNGAATPLIPIVNMGLDKVEAMAIAAVQAKILKAKAGMAATPATAAA